MGVANSYPGAIAPPQDPVRLALQRNLKNEMVNLRDKVDLMLTYHIILGIVPLFTLYWIPFIGPYLSCMGLLVLLSTATDLKRLSIKYQPSQVALSQFLVIITAIVTCLCVILAVIRNRQQIRRQQCLGDLNIQRIMQGQIDSEFAIYQGYPACEEQFAYVPVMVAQFTCLALAVIFLICHSIAISPIHTLSRAVLAGRMARDVNGNFIYFDGGALLGNVSASAGYPRPPEPFKENVVPASAPSMPHSPIQDQEQYQMPVPSIPHDVMPPPPAYSDQGGSSSSGAGQTYAHDSGAPEKGFR